MGVLDDVPWKWRHDTAPIRFQRLILATGWYGVFGWVTESGTVEFWWEPVIAWALRRGDSDSDDEVLPIMRLEGGPDIGIPSEGYGSKPIALHTEAERSDETLLVALREHALRQHQQNEADEIRRRQEADVVFGFVRAQPDPKAFAARLRHAGASSLHHVWLAVTLAEGDTARLVELVRMPVWQLAHWHREQRTKETTL